MNYHLKNTLSLAIPLIVSELARFGIGMTDTVMIGWYGTAELAALTLGHAYLFFIYISLTGFSLAVIAKMSPAFGRKDIKDLGLNLRMGIWLLLFFSIFGFILISNTKTVLLLLKQDENLIEIIDRYITIVRWMIPFILLSSLINAFLIVVKKERIVLVISLLALILNFFLNYCFIFGKLGFPEKGIEGLATASVGTSIAMVSVGLVYIYLSEIKNMNVFEKFFIFDFSVLFGLFTLGWPICLTILAESSMFSFASVLMGWIGQTQLAGHGISLTVFALFFMIPYGISQAGTVIVGKNLGEKKLIEIDAATFSIYSLGLIWAVFNTVIIIIFGDFIISLFLDETMENAKEVASYARLFLFVGCLFHLADSGQILFASILRGFSDTRTPFLICVFSYWIVGMPSAYVLSQMTNLSGAGVYWGIGSGLLVASVLLFCRFTFIKTKTKNTYFDKHLGLK